MSISSFRIKRLLICSIFIMAAGSMASNYGVSVVLPMKLEAMQSMDYYAFCSTLSTMGMMLALPLVGKLSELIGLKSVAIIGISLQFLARTAAIQTQVPALFMLLYAVSSIGGGLYMTLPFSFIADLVGEEERPKYYGFIAACNAVGALIGPLMTGQLIEKGYMSLGFIAYAPLSIFALICLAIFYPGKIKTQKKRDRFDFAGIALLFTAICSLVLWLNMGGKWFSWISLESLLLFACICTASVFLVRVELRHPNPSVPVGMFKKRRFRTSFICMALLSSYSTCAAGFGIVFVQQVMQVSPQTSATVTMPQTIAQALFGIIIGRIVGREFTKRFRPAALFALTLPACAALLLFSLGQDSSMLMVYTATAMGGITLAVSQSTFAPFFQAELSSDEYTSAQGMYTFGATGGSCIFMAVAGSMLNMGLTYNHIFLLSAFLCFAALIYGFFGFRLPVPVETKAYEPVQE